MKVALTLKSDGRKTVEKDTSATEHSTTEKGSDGNETLSKESALDEETIYQRGADGEESPYVVRRRNRKSWEFWWLPRVETTRGWQR